MDQDSKTLFVVAFKKCPNKNTHKSAHILCCELKTHDQFLSFIFFTLYLPVNHLCVVGSQERNWLNVCMFPPNHVVKLGGGPVSKATRVSFFASGPFPTCYQMSWSSTAEASKSSSLGAATGAANVRKPNTAARAGRFQLKLQTDGESDKLFSV